MNPAIAFGGIGGVGNVTTWGLYPPADLPSTINATLYVPGNTHGP